MIRLTQKCIRLISVQNGIHRNLCTDFPYISFSDPVCDHRQSACLRPFRPHSVRLDLFIPHRLGNSCIQIQTGIPTIPQIRFPLCKTDQKPDDHCGYQARQNNHADHFCLRHTHALILSYFTSSHEKFVPHNATNKNRLFPMLMMS